MRPYENQLQFYDPSKTKNNQNHGRKTLETARGSIDWFIFIAIPNRLPKETK